MSISTNDDKPFEPDEIIYFFDESLLVVENLGDKGIVIPLSEPYVETTYYWEYQGSKCYRKEK